MPTRRIQLRCMCLLLAWLYRGMVSVTTRISISRSVKSPAQADSSPPQAEPALQLNDAAADGDRHRLRAKQSAQTPHSQMHQPAKSESQPAPTAPQAPPVL